MLTFDADLNLGVKKTFNLDSDLAEFSIWTWLGVNFSGTTQNMHYYQQLSQT